MKFIDIFHKDFYLENLKIFQKYRQPDSYSKSLIYLLGLTETTRRNFSKIYNIKSGEIYLEALQAPFQTSTSIKLTRLCFNLYNGMVYENEEDIENKKVSSKYSVDEIFCSPLAPYFYNAVLLRYPQYSED